MTDPVTTTSAPATTTTVTTPAAPATTATSTTTTSAPGTTPAATDGGPKVGAPETYTDWTLPQGATLSVEQKTEFSTYAKGLNLTQEQAQKHLDRELKIRNDVESSVVSQQQAAVAKLSTDWKAATQADPEIGGDKLQGTLATAVKARDAFGSPSLIKMLDDSGMGNNPEVIRFFAKVGAAMSEDKIVQGGKPAAADTEQAKLQRMYPSMFQK